MINAGKSFTFPFEDKEWLSKLGTGALIGMIPFLYFAWMGYGVSIIRNEMNQISESLPAWDELDKKFIDGLRLSAASLIYVSPILVAVLLPLSVVVFSAISGGRDPVLEVSQRIAGIEGIFFLALFSILLGYGILLSFLYPAILVVFAREGTFASCFKLSRALALLNKNRAAFFAAWGWSALTGLSVGLLIGFINLVVGWIPCLGWIISFGLSLGSGVYTAAVRAHLFGQFGRIALEDHPPAFTNAG